LVEFIKDPKASFFELSVAVEKKGVKASEQAVAQLFKDYDLKKSTIIELIQFFRNRFQDALSFQQNGHGDIVACFALSFVSAPIGANWDLSPFQCQEIQ